MPNLSDEEFRKALESAAELGAERAIRKMTDSIYQEVGRTFIKRVFQGLGALVVAFVIWAAQNGWFK